MEDMLFEDREGRFWMIQELDELSPLKVKKMALRMCIHELT